jgi:hypothetical protein
MGKCVQAIKEVSMPAPFVIVTLRDKDGDDFPMRLQGTYEPGPQEVTLRSEATSELARMEREGEMRPNWPVTVANIEQF